LAYQPPDSSTFLSEQTSNQSAVLFFQNKSAPAISHHFLSEQISTSHQPNKQAEIVHGQKWGMLLLYTALKI
jgi:hypothetical protein